MADNIYYAVNKYLAKWDPIGLPLEIANVEYVDYVPDIVKSMTDRQNVISCLINFLDKIGTCKKTICNSIKEELFMRADDLLNLMMTSRSHDVYLRIFDNVPFKGIHAYYIIYDDVRKCVCRKVEVIKSDEVLRESNCQVSNSIKNGSHLTIKSIVERFYTEFISKEEFESGINEV